jgi:hypothetical protein
VSERADIVAVLRVVHQPKAFRMFCAECGQQVDEDGNCLTIRLAMGTEAPPFVPSGL